MSVSKYAEGKAETGCGSADRGGHSAAAAQPAEPPTPREATSWRGKDERRQGAWLGATRTDGKARLEAWGEETTAGLQGCTAGRSPLTWEQKSALELLVSKGTGNFFRLCFRLPLPAHLVCLGEPDEVIKKL